MLPTLPPPPPEAAHLPSIASNQTNKAVQVRTDVRLSVCPCPSPPSSALSNGRTDQRTDRRTREGISQQSQRSRGFQKISTQRNEKMLSWKERTRRRTNPEILESFQASLGRRRRCEGRKTDEQTDRLSRLSTTCPIVEYWFLDSEQEDTLCLPAPK